MPSPSQASGHGCALYGRIPRSHSHPEAGTGLKDRCCKKECNFVFILHLLTSTLNFLCFSKVWGLLFGYLSDGFFLLVSQGLRTSALEDCALCQETISSSELAAKARDGEFEGIKQQ